jgi:serine/threonine protein kinase
MLRREVESLLAQPVSADGPLDGAAAALVSDIAAPLATGTRIGVYTVQGLLGKGGMGEVYRAIDTNLKRQVALKVLPAPVASDSERVARFQREAEVLASLNHSNIAAVYGLERADGAAALVMELVDGPTLADRVARGALPLDQVLAIAVQVADALEAAHERGIVHRDLKPANIKVRPDGAVKLLDFGLAKALEPPAHSYDPLLPTITSPALLTGTGMILGTAAYMAPEQARGESVTKRADIWAFGCVLYELLTGRRAFAGATVAETLSAVLLKEPDWTLLPRETPAAVLRLLRRALQKPERQLLQTPLLSASSWKMSKRAATPLRQSRPRRDPRQQL